jgi:hypothetical protein
VNNSLNKKITGPSQSMPGNKTQPEPVNETYENQKRKQEDNKK